MVKKRRRLSADPHWQREKDQYDQPAPSREFILEYISQLSNKTLTFDQACADLQVSHPDAKLGFQYRLKAMVRSGQLMRKNASTFYLPDERRVVEGIVQAYRDGTGIVVDERGQELYLPYREMRAVFPGDVVKVQALGQYRGRHEACIVQLVQANTTTCVGRISQSSSGIQFQPCDRRIVCQIALEDDPRLTAAIGQYLRVEIIQHPFQNKYATARLQRVLGDEAVAGIERHIAVGIHQLPHRWPSGVRSEADRSAEQDISCQGRKDCRHLPFVTIDGQQAKDFDDAIACERVSRGGFKLTVAIADVSHYVRPDSLCDREALDRGNSVYFTSKVIPMLPEALSNEVCSLKPNVDRYALICEIQLTAKGRMKDYQFYEACIHSSARLTYDQVHHWMNEGLPKDGLSADVTASMQALIMLYRLLDQLRQKRGAIQFNPKSVVAQYAQTGKIEAFTAEPRYESHRLVEEMMLLANTAAANWLKKQAEPSLYRVHPPPDTASLLKCRQLLRLFGYRLMGKDQPSGKDYNQLLGRIRSHSLADVLELLLLRSMAPACYSSDQQGHYGLGYPHYTHFTSPIRRYSDLVVHRLIKASLGYDSGLSYSQVELERIAQHCSMTERRADLATRDAMDWLKCYFMQERCGQVVQATIVDVMAFGVFVECDQWLIQGLVHISDLSDDHYLYDKKQHALIGRRKGARLSLGLQVKVMCTRVDMDQRRLDFTIIKGKQQPITSRVSKGPDRRRKKPRK